MKMSSADENLFHRLQHIVEEKFEGNRSKFSDELDVSRNYLYGMEKKLKEGKMPNPEYRVLSPLVEKYNVNPVWLFTGKGKPFSGTDEQEILSLAQTEEEKELISRVLKNFGSLSALAKNDKQKGSLLLAFRDQLQSQIKQSESLVNLIGLIESDE